MTQFSIFDLPRANPAAAPISTHAKPSPDVCRNRHRGAENSEKANEKVQPHKANVRERVRIFVAGCGHEGATLKEICKAFDKYPNALSGRLTELVASGQVFKSGRKRDDHEVYVQRSEWANGSAK